MRAATLLLLVVVGTLSAIALAPRGAQTADAPAAAKPFGIEKRVPWTTSRVQGSPEPAALWPRQTTLPPVGTLAALPVPAASLFKMPESARLTLLASSAHRAAAAQARSTEAPSAKLAGKSRHHGRAAAAQPPASAGQTAQAPQGAGGIAAKPAAQAKRNGRSVRVAGLKKR